MKSKLVMGIWAVVIAFGLWVYVITAVSPGSEVTVEGVPVSVQGQTTLHERDLMIVKTLDTAVDIRLAGNRSDLVKLDKNDISITVNVADLDKSTADENGTVSLFYTVRVRNDIATVVSSSPDKIRVVLEDRVARDIPVVINYGDTQTPDGFEEEAATMDYQSIPVLGPKSVVEKIDRAEVKVDLTDKKQTIEQTLVPTFINEDGTETNTDLLKWEIEEVTIMIPIKCVKEIPVLVNVIPGLGANEDNTSIELEYTKIRVAGSEGLLADLDSVTLIDTVDLGEIFAETTITSSFVLPPEVTIKEPATSNKEVVITITFPDLIIREVDVPIANLEYLNLPEGLQAEAVSETVRVIVRGSKALVEQLTPEDIRFTLDLAGAKTGEKNWELKVVLDEEYEQLGILEAVTARIALSQKNERSIP